GSLDRPRGRKNVTRRWSMQPGPHGQPAATPWKVIGRSQQLSWLALEPLTGRTHQLRVHCAAMGWPIVGDNVYGSAPRSGGPPLHLHSREIVVPLYKNREPIRVMAPVPLHMHERRTACGWAGEGVTLIDGDPAPYSFAIVRSGWP